MAMTDVRLAYSFSFVPDGKKAKDRISEALVHIKFDDIEEARLFTKSYTHLIGTHFEGMEHTNVA